MQGERMSSFGESIGKRRRDRGSAPGASALSPAFPAARAALPASVATGPSAAGQPVAAHSELGRRRDALAAQVIELHWDLGGLAYEMAIRDHFRLDVLVRRDAELAELERLLALEERAIAGGCADCGAPHSRGAVYCWQCGATLLQSAPSSGLPAIENESSAAPRVMIDALLASDAPSAEELAARRSPLTAFGEE